MAHPKVHVISTHTLALVYLLGVGPLALRCNGQDVMVVALVVLFGILIDADHLSIRKIKKILRGEKGPIPGWVNWMHTWQALVGVIIIVMIIGNVLPFIAYIMHILIDGADRANLTYPNSPLPTLIYRFYPRWMTYYYE